MIMTRSRPRIDPGVAPAPLGPEFDAFLFAQAGEDRAGTPISVVTLLARLDLDPWQEAARLAALAPEIAAVTVTSVLEALPNASLNPRDNVSLAVRLVAMLPRATAAHGTKLQRLFATSGQTATRWRESVLFLAIYLIVMLATQFAMTSINPHHSNAASASASNSAPLQSVSVPSGN
jgi:hypothetical protein